MLFPENISSSRACVEENKHSLSQNNNVKSMSQWLGEGSKPFYGV